MDDLLRTTLWNQFGAALDMLERAIDACPDELWGSERRWGEVWNLAQHTVVWTDFYLSDAPDAFRPPAPFGMTEFDPDGALPERAYTKAEVLDYLAHVRERARAVIGGLTRENAGRLFGSRHKPDFTVLEILIYNLRHVHHHVGQLNLLLRQRTDAAPGWVSRTAQALED